jgi:hypothetical protein
VGIVNLFKSQRSRDIKPKTGLPDAVAVEKIQHCTDRLGGFAGQVMKFCNIPRGYVSPRDIFLEQIIADEGSTVVSLVGICPHVPHFSLLFSSPLGYLLKKSSG